MSPSRTSTSVTSRNRRASRDRLNQVVPARSPSPTSSEHGTTLLSLGPSPEQGLRDITRIKRKLLPTTSLSRLTLDLPSSGAWSNRNASQSSVGYDDPYIPPPNPPDCDNVTRKPVPTASRQNLDNFTTDTTTFEKSHSWRNTHHTCRRDTVVSWITELQRQLGEKFHRYRRRTPPDDTSRATIRRQGGYLQAGTLRTKAIKCYEAA